MHIGTFSHSYGEDGNIFNIYFIYFLPNGKKIWNNTEKIRRILKFVSNFKGVDKLTFLEEIYIFVGVVCGCLAISFIRSI